VVRAEDLVYKDRLLAALVKKVPETLKTYDPRTGHFGTGIWTCRDQQEMYPLAIAYATNAPGNKYHKDPKLLDVIVKAGDALIADANDKGQWVFRKKDGSTWGDIWMPWTYSRWIRTFGLIRDDMPADRRMAWEKALTLGYTGIGKSQLGHLANIPTHHAMGLYIAGKTLNRPEWCRQAAEFMDQKVLPAQAEGGYWSEGGGPVIEYNFVYVEAIGIYYAASGDERVLPALRRAAEYHWHFTYPDGRSVETIDQRNPYSPAIHSGNVGFTFTPEGRAYLKRQWDLIGMNNLKADEIAALLQYGKEGPLAAAPPGTTAQTFVLTDKGQDKAAIIRQGPWFVCLSAYTTPVATNRWYQDRQNMMSVFHDKVGLVIGGGNTKLQPAWSSFTVGDESLLRHKPGDTKPDFLPPPGKLFHVPSAATLLREPCCGLDLTYGKETCRIQVQPKDERTLVCTLSATAVSGMPVAAHLTLWPHLKQAVETGGGQRFELGDSPVTLSADQVGGSVAHAGWRITVPKTATLTWPALPHNPYRKDGRAEAGEGRISIRIPFDAQHRQCEATLAILK
jgi:hypothetical protein